MKKTYMVSLNLIVEENEVDNVVGYLNGMLALGDIDEYGEYIESDINVEDYGTTEGNE